MKWSKVAGVILFVIALGLFCLQMVYFYVHSKYQLEYSDDRFFFYFNIAFILCVGGALFLLLTPSKWWKWFIPSIVIVFSVWNVYLLTNLTVKNYVSISPDFSNVFVIKKNPEMNSTQFYRTYYHIFARPRETLPYETTGIIKLKWLENDIAAATYMAKDGSLHQYIGTYGDRGGGHSYYYVGPSIHGDWEGENANVSSDTSGITVQYNGETEVFPWDQVIQFGTLAVVLVDDYEAKWTIALHNSFVVNSDGVIPEDATIGLYKAALEENEQVQLHYRGSMGE